MEFDTNEIRNHARSFDKERFKKELQQFIDAKLADHMK
jgi:hypothetical protein